MDHEQQRRELRQKLERYEALARKFSDGLTFENIQREIAALKEELWSLQSK